MRRRLYAYEDCRQKQCYKCGSEGYVRQIKHPVLGQVYNVCCSNSECGNATLRNYVWRCSAVKAWNRMPNVLNKLYDNFLEKISM